MLFHKIYPTILFLFIFQLSVHAQDSLKTQLNKNNTPQTLQLSHIEIQEQFIDFKKLKDPAYSQQFDFGKALLQSFDSVAAHYNYPTNLNLPHYLNTLTFHFSDIDWKAPHKIKYSYYLQGLDENWSEPNNNSKAAYHNLPHGNYTLKIKAAGETQVWSEPFIYTFKIQTPWWRSWRACTLYTLIVLAGFYALFHFWQERKRQEAEIQRLLKAYKLTDLPKAFEMKRAYGSSF